MAKIIAERFAIGTDLTRHELESAYKSICGRTLNRRSPGTKIATELSRRYPERFEFEVNLVRGFAYEGEFERIAE